MLPAFQRGHLLFSVHRVLRGTFKADLKRCPRCPFIEHSADSELSRIQPKKPMHTSLLTPFFPEPIFQQNINDLEFSDAFKHITAQYGYYTLIDLASQPLSRLAKLPGFTILYQMEYSRFMETRNLGHYIDDPD